MESARRATTEQNNNYLKHPISTSHTTAQRTTAALPNQLPQPSKRLDNLSTSMRSADNHQRSAIQMADWLKTASSKKTLLNTGHFDPIGFQANSNNSILKLKSTYKPSFLNANQAALLIRGSEQFIKQWQTKIDAFTLDKPSFSTLPMAKDALDRSQMLVITPDADCNRFEADLVTLHASPIVKTYPEKSTNEHTARAWYGWDALKINTSSTPSANATPQESKPLLTCLDKPEGNLDIDTNHIDPVLTQEQINVLYDVMARTHEVLTQNDVPYFGGAGTLMGAIRHGGQMWNDDDGDLFLRVDDKDKIEQLRPAFEAQGLRLQAGWPGFQISDQNSPTRSDGTGVPFVDLVFMNEATNEQGEKVWEHIDSPQARGEASGPTFLHVVPAHVFDNDARQTIAFGKSVEPNGFKGIPLSVPKEKESIDYLNTAYKANWFDVLKTRVHNHITGGQSKSLTLGITLPGHVTPKAQAKG